MNYTKNELQKNNYYVMYDLNDNVVSCFESYEDLFRVVKIPIYELVRKFKDGNDYINVVVGRKTYKLYTYFD